MGFVLLRDTTSPLYIGTKADLRGLIIVGRITDVISPLVFESLRWSAGQSNRELRPNGIWSKLLLLVALGYIQSQA